jgi:hypothetical protein
MKIKKVFCFISVVAILITQANAINLGGTQVPKENFIVYLLIGHSDMAGVIDTGNDSVTNPHAWVYRWATTKTWQLAKEVDSLTDGLGPGGTGGPGMPFIKLLVSRYPTTYFGVINNASYSATCWDINAGGDYSSISAANNRYHPGALLFQEIITAARAIMDSATLGGILCMLGTVEATRAANISVCQNFSNEVDSMVTNMRDSLGLPNLPFIMDAYENGATGSFALTNLWPSIVAQQIDSVPYKVSLSVIVNSVGIQMWNDHEYSPAGQKEFATRAVDSIQAKGFLPPATATLPFNGLIAAKTDLKEPLTISYAADRVKIEYHTTSDAEVLINVFSLEGACLLHQRMTKSGGMFSVFLDKRSFSGGAAGPGCYIAMITQTNSQKVAKFYLMR